MITEMYFSICHGLSKTYRLCNAHCFDTFQQLPYRKEIVEADKINKMLGIRYAVSCRQSNLGPVSESLWITQSHSL